MIWTRVEDLLLSAWSPCHSKLTGHRWVELVWVGSFVPPWSLFTDIPVPQWPALLCWMPWLPPRTVYSCPLRDKTKVGGRLNVEYTSYNSAFLTFPENSVKSINGMLVAKAANIDIFFFLTEKNVWNDSISSFWKTHFRLSSSGSFMSFCILTTKKKFPFNRCGHT